MLVSEEINEQGFELINKRIGDIINTNINHQKSLGKINFKTTNVSELLRPYNISDGVLINNYVASLDYGTSRSSAVECNGKFIIECTVGASGNIHNKGYSNSSHMLTRTIGILRYVFSSTKLKRLGFKPDNIGHVGVSDIYFDQNFNPNDSNNTRNAFITLDIKFLEEQKLWEPDILEGIDSDITINEDKQIKLTYNK